MLIYSDVLTIADLSHVAESMPVQLYDCEHDFHGARRRRFKTLIRPEHGDAGERWRKLSGSSFHPGRRLFACSWHAHYVFMSALFELDPNAEVKTALAHWRGREDFHARAPMTAELNWGSMMYPAYAGQLANYCPSVEEMCREACAIAGTDYEPADPDDREIRFGDFAPDTGLTNVRVIQQSTIMRCPHVILMPDHYRPDGSCKCDDPSENIMAEWGYHWDATTNRWEG